MYYICKDIIDESSRFDSDSSIDTLSSLLSFSSSDLNIDSEVEARLNNRYSLMSVDDTETTKEEIIEKGSDERTKSNKIKI